jgi:uncharacterized flavoprotein (TIGR03862 family)
LTDPAATSPATIAVIGAGPAGLMVAEVLAAAGRKVVVFEKTPSAGRKFLMAGRGGLNLTHSEAFDRFAGRYGAATTRLRPLLDAFPPAALTAWAEGLGQATFTGSSGRVFPRAMKASPLLRAWLRRLESLGVQLRTRRDWRGWDAEGRLAFATPEGGIETFAAEATVLTLGGASWPRLGSDGAWAGMLAARGVEIAPFRPANSGFDVAWSPLFRDRFAGEPLKAAGFHFAGRTVRGEAVISRYGLEGGAIYALSAWLRDAVAAKGSAVLKIDLRPDLPSPEIAARLGRAKAGQSLANTLRKSLHLSALETHLLREAGEVPTTVEALAARIKSVPVTLTGVQGLARAISSAGGIALSELDEGLMLRRLPGVFAAGEMLDWEAPTGGYLLQACFATGAAAGAGVLRWLGAS